MAEQADLAARGRVDAAKATIMQAIGQAGFDNMMTGGNPDEIGVALIEIVSEISGITVEVSTS